MSEKICLVIDCGRPGVRRKYCSMHYQRFMKTGSPLVGARTKTPEDAFAKFAVSVAGGCLLWTAGKDRDGYGNIAVYGRKTRAHRYAWERIYGPMPDGMQVDHKCWNPSCVNIEHLRLANHAENQHYRNGSHRGSKTGFRNVYDRGTHFQVMIGRNGKQRHYGTFATIEEAVDAAELKRAELFGEFAGRG
ncbi:MULTISPECIES: HNH endonuclease [Brevibacterium]|uniref:HNH endonuclease n=1 Tax=Brevibacterium antiquum CNRZ 918 TaxID=1255637 RepID=A0A2H1KEN2_9MICO|nr:MULTISPECIES: HNH endonuclease [Brevibacterium]SMX98166.1 HNH endonuclease [Brevibacterium antiquum CNRZ 918]HCG55324.1 hypothetical protein [Brevibacterium sp.]